MAMIMVMVSLTYFGLKDGGRQAEIEREICMHGNVELNTHAHFVYSYGSLHYTHNEYLYHVYIVCYKFG